MTGLDQLRLVALRTLAFFQACEFPLTPAEVWQYTDWRVGALLAAPSIGQVEQLLQGLARQGQVQTAWGMWGLADVARFAEQRAQRYLIAERKYQQALRAAWWLRLIPGVRLICAANTLGYSNTREESDIDLFVIVEHGRLWQARFLAAELLDWLHWQPGQRAVDPICPSFWVSEDHLDLSDLLLPGQGTPPERDPYLWWWVQLLQPVYDHPVRVAEGRRGHPSLARRGNPPASPLEEGGCAEGYYQRFLEANRWVRDDLPLSAGREPLPRRTVSASMWSLRIQRWLEKLADWYGLEAKAKESQMWHMPAEVLERAKADDHAVVISDSVLKFHENDRRGWYRQEWERLLKV